MVNRSISDAVSVIASKTNVKISKAFNPQDKLNLLIEVQISAVTETTGITLKLLESAGGSDFHEVGDQSEVSLTSMSLASATDIANATDTFTETAHARITGAPVIFNEGTAAPAGLTGGEKYFIISTGANTFKLALTYAQAIEGDNLSITDDGTGTQVFFDARYEIRMVESDSSDAAQLPVHDYLAVGIDTGSGDTITISRIYG